MRFAKIVFICAGIWGMVVLTPLYWLVDVTGRQHALIVLYSRNRISAADFQPALPDFLLGVLFVVALMTTQLVESAGRVEL